MSLKQAAKEALSIKCDVECQEALTKLRRECREKGIDSDRVNRIIRATNHELHHKPEPKPDAGVSPEELPTTQEVQKEMQSKLPEEVLSQRVTTSYSTSSGMNPSGGKLRQSKMSILDLADKK